MKVKVTEPTYDVGVIVGRFQVPQLHDGHKALIQTVSERHDMVVLILGCSPLWSTKSNPLDRMAREQMIGENFPNVWVKYINDHPSDNVWSQKLDSLVKELCGPARKAMLYGSRDSFIQYYHGVLPTAELEAESVLSGTEARKLVGTAKTRPTEDFRAGVVYATQQRYGIAYPTVDIAILDGPSILLGRKQQENRFRFVGGFVDPKDESKEAAARREVQEETGLSVTDPKYVGSLRVDDWRYRSEVDKVMTSVYVAHKQFGKAKPADDISEVRWVPSKELNDDFLQAEHRPILALLRAKKVI